VHHKPKYFNDLRGVMASAREGADIAVPQSASESCVRAAVEPLLYGVGGAIILTLFLRETGPAARRAVS
jgi:hypothetical protein